MRKSLVLGSSLLATLAAAAPVSAATYYVAPNGVQTSGCTVREMACDLASGAALAMPGDTVILMDGVYKTGLNVPNSGTSDAWITFQADTCSTPIIEGIGAAPTDDNQDSGVYSATAQYLKFIGIVSRGWSTGFGNGWTGNVASDSNGYWDIEYCISDGNGRTGFTFFSAPGFTLKHSIAAHNGSSTLHSWSSGITLYSSQGNGRVEGNISFENMDAEQHTDGSGFIVDEASDGASFINNIAFRNGGSCLRLTRSMNTKFINNTCYHDSQDMADTGPTNPGEVYFTAATDNSTTTGTTFMNNVFVATGTGPGAEPIYNKPTTGWSNNVEKTGSVNYFTSAESDFTLAAGAADLLMKGGTGAGVPTDDVGFDPKCITKKTPTLVGSIAVASWWQYSVDIDYVKSIGGVQSRFNPKARSGTPDIGAYANGAVTTKMPGNCTPPMVVMTGVAGMTGMGGASGGSAPTAGDGGVLPAGGAPGAGGMAPAAGTTSTGVGGGAPSGGMMGATTGGTSPGAGAPTGNPSGGHGPTGTGGSTNTSGGTSPGTSGGSGGGGNASGSGGKDSNASSGCGCRVANEDHPKSLAALGLLGVALLGLRRRRS